MTYVDGFVVAVQTAKKDEYIQHSRACVPIFKKHGAIRQVESWGVEVPDGKLTSFPIAVKAKPDETVVFSWIEWPSKAIRDKGMEAVIADPFFAEEHDVPFDGARMIFGSFDVILDE